MFLLRKRQQTLQNSALCSKTRRRVAAAWLRGIIYRHQCFRPKPAGHEIFLTKASVLTTDNRDLELKKCSKKTKKNSNVHHEAREVCWIVLSCGVVSCGPCIQYVTRCFPVKSLDCRCQQTFHSSHGAGICSRSSH